MRVCALKEFKWQLREKHFPPWKTANCIWYVLVPLQPLLAAAGQAKSQRALPSGVLLWVGGTWLKVEVQNFLLTVNHADSTIVVQTFFLLCFSQNHLYWIPGVGGQLATSLYRMGQCDNWECITRGILYFFPQTEETITVLFIKHLPDDLYKYIFTCGCAVSTLLPVFVQCVIK